MLSPELAVSATDLIGDKTPADAANFLIGKALSIVLILVLAVIVNRLARRARQARAAEPAVRRVQERLGTLRAATPDALLETGNQLRAEQRIEALAERPALADQLRHLRVAAFMILGEVGIELGPLIAGAGILGVALGFGSQSLVSDFLSGVFILVEDQFGVGDIVDLDERRPARSRPSRCARPACARSTAPSGTSPTARSGGSAT